MLPTASHSYTSPYPQYGTNGNTLSPAFTFPPPSHQISRYPQDAGSPMSPKMMATFPVSPMSPSANRNIYAHNVIVSPRKLEHINCILPRSDN